MRGTWEAVKNVLVTGEIPRWYKEMMFAAISMDGNCKYCAAAHIACCRMLRVQLALIESVARDTKSPSDHKLRDIIKFAIKCSRDSQSLQEEDCESLRQHGLRQSEIMEIIAMSAFAVYANIIADATAMGADQMFGTL